MERNASLPSLSPSLLILSPPPRFLFSLSPLLHVHISIPLYHPSLIPSLFSLSPTSLLLLFPPSLSLLSPSVLPSFPLPLSPSPPPPPPPLPPFYKVSKWRIMGQEGSEYGVSLMVSLSFCFVLSVCLPLCLSLSVLLSIFLVLFVQISTCVVIFSLSVDFYM